MNFGVFFGHLTDAGFVEQKKITKKIVGFFVKTEKNKKTKNKKQKRKTIWLVVEKANAKIR